MLKPVAVAAIIAISIAACGGGSSGSGTPPAPPIPVPPDPVPPDPVPPDPVTVTPYPANSPELSLFTSINALREANGLPLFVQSNQLDQVASHHRAYLKSHDATPTEWQSGIELPAQPGFTGATAQDRCTAVGYTGTCAQERAWSQPAYACDASPYFGLVVLDQSARQVGIEIPDCIAFGGMSCGPDIQLGQPAGGEPAALAADAVLVAALHGTIHIQVSRGERLSISRLVVRDSGGNLLGGTLLTQANDPLGRIPAHAAVYILDSTSMDGVYSIELEATRQGQEPVVWPFVVQRTVTGSCP